MSSLSDKPLDRAFEIIRAAIREQWLDEAIIVPVGYDGYGPNEIVLTLEATFVRPEQDEEAEHE